MATTAPAAAKRKLSFKEQQEFDKLPKRIAELEDEQAALQRRIEEPAFYQEGAAAIKETMARIDQVQNELDAALARWDELDSKKPH